METVHATPYDFVVLGIFLLLLLRGLWVGFLGQVVPLLSLYLGYLAASRYHQQLLPFLQDISTNPKVIFLSAYAILFFATFIVSTLLGKGLALVVQITIAPWFDRLLGMVLGCAKALIIVIFMHIILGTLLAPENPMLRTCQSCSALNGLSDLTRQVIKDEDIRESLRQNTPAISLDTLGSLFRRDAVAQPQSEPVPAQ